MTVNNPSDTGGRHHHHHDMRNGITFAQFIYGEIGQESGGNYHAQSPAGALGKYQILASNIPSWSREILGHSITAQEFLEHPALQDAIAIGMLYRYFQKYGPQGAASAWYTGDPNAWLHGGGGDNYGGPSAAGYVSQVMARAETYNGDGSDLTFSGQPIQNANQVEQLTGYHGRSHLGGPGMAGSGGGHGTQFYILHDPLHHFLMQVPELRAIVEKAAQHDWSIDRFVNQIEQSPWWQSHSASARQFLIERSTDHATFVQNLQNATEAVRVAANQLGIPVTPQQIHSIAVTGLLTGNISLTTGAADHVWLSNALANNSDYAFNSSQGLQGGMAQTVGQLQSLAAQYGFKNWSSTQEAQMAQDILTGKTTMATFEQQVKDWAASAFPAYAKQIQAGQTVAQLAAPYVSSMSNMLEVNPQNLDTFTPKIRQAMQGTSDGKGNFTPTPLWQFEQQLRQDPRWQYTDNAHQTMADVLTQVGQDWGFA